MEILLIDVDSKIPNLALMKISSYHKKLGDHVGFNISDPDRVYASIVFTENKWKGNGIKKMYPNVSVVIGGSGYALKKELSDDIEHMIPDYDLYNIDYSMGFTTRGCIRKCPFCIVPQKEGKLRPHCTIFEFWNTKHKHIMLLDNNILADHDHFNIIAQQIMDNNLSVDFNQGLDIRLINDVNANILSELRVKPDYRFAWDNPNDEQVIKEKIKILKDHNINHCLFYVLVGFNTTQEQDLHRLQVLKELDQRPYVMRYKSCNGNRWYNDLASWANQQRFFMKMDFDHYCKCRHNRLIKIEG